MRYLIPFILLLAVSCSNEIIEDDNLLETLMKTRPDQFESIINNVKKNKVQIIYTRISRDSLNRPSFRTFYFNHQLDEYFYPASTVKLPASILALEKLNNLNIANLNKDTPMFTDSAWSGQSVAHYDSTSESHLPSIGHYIKKILLVSDNDAYNRLYEFLGQEYFNDVLWEKGYTSRMTHRLSIFLSPLENSITNPIQFIQGDTIYHHRLAKNENSIAGKEPILLGEKHYSGGKLINRPMDFRLKNYFNLTDQHAVLKSLFFGNSTPEKQRFNLSEKDLRFLYSYMSKWPSESTYPNYRDRDDNYVKFLMYGSGKYPISKNVRIFNKVGQAYGFQIDNAYIVDFKEKIEFLVSAVIYTNDNNILNDGDYEYEEVGLPFLADLGQILYKYELNHRTSHSPNLSQLQESILYQ